MKCLIKLNNFLYIFIIRLCIFKLIIYNNNNYVQSFKTSTPVVKHPGTCTFQQSQSACTFSLLCYLAGGIPIEGSRDNNLPSSSTVLPPSSTTYADQLDTDQQRTQIIDSLSTSSKNPIENNQPPTESNLLLKNSNSNKYLNDDESNLHFSSSSLSASTNPFDSISGYQTHQIHHSPRSLYPPINHPSSLQYHHRLQHIYSATSANPHHLNHQKQHQQNLYLHQQRLASHHPFYHHSHSIYHSPHSSPYNLPTSPPPIQSSNARSFHLQPNRYNNHHHLISQYPQTNYFLKDLNDNLNYYSDSYLNNAAEQAPSSYNSGDHNFNLNEQNAYSSLGDLSSPTSSIPSSANVYNAPSPSNNPSSNLNNESDNNLPTPTAYDYPNPSSNLLSTYSPTQTIDYKTYQKHTVNPDSYTTANNNLNHQSSSNNLHFPPIYSTSSSTSSFESTTNHSNLYNSNKIYGKSDYTPNEPPISIKYYKNSNYEPTTNYNTAVANNNRSPDENPINSDDETRLISGNLDNNRLTAEEEDYNNNAIRRSRLASSSLNSITLDKQIHGRNYIEEDICGKPLSKPTSRIIGGQDAYYGEFPFMVHIKIGKHQCGGALISSQYVITASHCVYQAPVEQLVIIMGVHDIESHNSKYYDEIPQRHAVESVHLHPNFRFSAAHPDRFDVALLKLKRPAVFTNSVRPVCLPSPGLKLEGWKAIVTGWGKTDSTILNRFGTRILQKVDVPIIKNTECEEWHQTRGIDLKIFPEMMCAGYEDGQKDACVGDSGGPLVIFINGRYTLAGITSAGFSCATQRQPGIYHRIPYTVDWILDQINNENK